MHQFLGLAKHAYTYILYLSTRCSNDQLRASTKSNESNLNATNQLLCVLKGLDVKINVLQSAKLQQFCAGSTNSMKEDVGSIFFRFNS